MNHFFTILLCSIFVYPNAFSQAPILVEDLNSGLADGFDRDYIQNIRLDDFIVFPANNGASGLEPFALQNGVISLLADINSGTASSNPGQFIAFKNKVYFTAYSPTLGGAIWATDGVTTELMIDVSPETTTETPIGLIVSASDHLYFSYNGKLYQSDGTDIGTLEIPGNVNVDFRDYGPKANPRRTTYEEGIAFLSVNADASKVQLWAASDEMSLLGEVDVNIFFLGTYGLYEVSNGLVFCVTSSLEQEVSGTFVYKADTESIHEIEIDGDTPPAKRVLNFDENRVIAPYGLKGYLVIDGETGNETLINENVYTLLAGQRIPNTKVGDYMYIAEEDKIFSMTILKTDGTVDGTSVIPMDEGFSSNFITDGTHAYWATGTTTSVGMEFWQANPTANSLEQIYKYPEDTDFSGTIILIGVLDNQLYFIADKDDDEAGLELYALELATSSTNESEQARPYTFSYSPNRGIIHSTFQEPLQMRIYNFQGQVLKTEQIFTNSIFELSLPLNAYILEISGAQGRIVEKIMVK